MSPQGVAGYFMTKKRRSHIYVETVVLITLEVFSNHLQLHSGLTPCKSNFYSTTCSPSLFILQHSENN